MKKMVCEMCESTAFVKENEFFVCKGCGMSYTLEAAKKLMVEVEDTSVPAAPQNTQAYDNLLKLAQTSFDSENYEQTENLCTQVLSQDSSCYDAWLLKGKAVAKQYSADNDRILEAYNCMMTAYQSIRQDLDKSEATKLADTVLETIEDTLKSALLLWVKRLETERPVPSMIAGIKAIYPFCREKLVEAYDRINVRAQWQKDRALFNLNIALLYNCQQGAVKSWKTMVSYNYYRDEDPERWERYLGSSYTWYYDEYRPNTEILQTFVQETDLLVFLLLFCVEQFTDTTSSALKAYVLDDLSYYIKAPIGTYSYALMEETTTNGFGAVIERKKYFTHDRRYSSFSSYQGDRDEDAKLFAQLAKEERIKAYWKKNDEEKVSLDAELAELSQKQEALKAQIAENKQKCSKLREEIAMQTPAELEKNKKRVLVGQLTRQLEGVGLFAFKEKKALKAQLQEEQSALDALSKQAATEREARDKEIAPLKKELLAEKNASSRLSEAEHANQKRIKEIEKLFAQDRECDLTLGDLMYLNVDALIEELS